MKDSRAERLRKGFVSNKSKKSYDILVLYFHDPIASMRERVRIRKVRKREKSKIYRERTEEIEEKW